MVWVDAGHVWPRVGKGKKEIEAWITDATPQSAKTRRAPNNFNEGGAQNNENQTTLGPRRPKS